MSGKQLPKVPEGLRDLMKNLTKEILREKPADIYAFSAKFFENIVEKQQDFIVKEFEPISEYDFLKFRERTSVPAALLYSIMPAGLTKLIKDFIKVVLKIRPENICLFGVEYFRQLEKVNQNEPSTIDYMTFQSYFKSQEKLVYTPYIKCSCGRTLGGGIAFNNNNHLEADIWSGQSSDGPKEACDAKHCKNYTDYGTTMPENTVKAPINHQVYDEKAIRAIYILQKFCRQYIKKKKIITSSNIVHETSSVLQNNAQGAIEGNSNGNLNKEKLSSDQTLNENISTISDKDPLLSNEEHHSSIGNANLLLSQENEIEQIPEHAIHKRSVTNKKDPQNNMLEASKDIVEISKKDENFYSYESNLLSAENKKSYESLRNTKNAIEGLPIISETTLLATTTNDTTTNNEVTSSVSSKIEHSKNSLEYEMEESISQDQNNINPNVTTDCDPEMKMSSEFETTKDENYFKTHDETIDVQESNLSSRIIAGTTDQKPSEDISGEINVLHTPRPTLQTDLDLLLDSSGNTNVDFGNTSPIKDLENQLHNEGLQSIREKLDAEDDIKNTQNIVGRSKDEDLIHYKEQDLDSTIYESNSGKDGVTTVCNKKIEQNETQELTHGGNLLSKIGDIPPNVERPCQNTGKESSDKEENQICIESKNERTVEESIVEEKMNEKSNNDNIDGLEKIEIQNEEDELQTKPAENKAIERGKTTLFEFDNIEEVKQNQNQIDEAHSVSKNINQIPTDPGPSQQSFENIKNTDLITPETKVNTETSIDHKTDDVLVKNIISETPCKTEESTESTSLEIIQTTNETKLESVTHEKESNLTPKDNEPIGKKGLEQDIKDLLGSRADIAVVSVENKESENWSQMSENQKNILENTAINLESNNPLSEVSSSSKIGFAKQSTENLELSQEQGKTSAKTIGVAVEHNKTEITSCNTQSKMAALDEENEPAESPFQNIELQKKIGLENVEKKRMTSPYTESKITGVIEERKDNKESQNANQFENMDEESKVNAIIIDPVPEHTKNVSIKHLQERSDDEVLDTPLNAQSFEKNMDGFISTSADSRETESIKNPRQQSIDGKNSDFENRQSHDGATDNLVSVKTVSEEASTRAGNGAKEFSHKNSDDTDVVLESVQANEKQNHREITIDSKSQVIHKQSEMGEYIPQQRTNEDPNLENSEENNEKSEHLIEAMANKETEANKNLSQQSEDQNENSREDVFTINSESEISLAEKGKELSQTPAQQSENLKENVAEKKMETESTEKEEDFPVNNLGASDLKHSAANDSAQQLKNCEAIESERMQSSEKIEDGETSTNAEPEFVVLEPDNKVQKTSSLQSESYEHDDEEHEPPEILSEQSKDRNDSLIKEIGSEGDETDFVSDEEIKCNENQTRQCADQEAEVSQSTMELSDNKPLVLESQQAIPINSEVFIIKQEKNGGEGYSTENPAENILVHNESVEGTKFVDEEVKASKDLLPNENGLEHNVGNKSPEDKSSDSENIKPREENGKSDASKDVEVTNQTSKKSHHLEQVPACVDLPVEKPENNSRNSLRSDAAIPKTTFNENEQSNNNVLFSEKENSKIEEDESSSTKNREETTRNSNENLSNGVIQHITAYHDLEKNESHTHKPGSQEGEHKSLPELQRNIKSREDFSESLDPESQSEGKENTTTETRDNADNHDYGELSGVNEDTSSRNSSSVLVIGNESAPKNTKTPKSDVNENKCIKKYPKPKLESKGQPPNKSNNSRSHQDVAENTKEKHLRTNAVQKAMQLPIAEIYLKSFRQSMDNENPRSTPTDHINDNANQNRKTLTNATPSETASQGSDEVEYPDSLEEDKFERDSLEVGSSKDTDLEDDSLETDHFQKGGLNPNTELERTATYLYGIQTPEESPTLPKKNGPKAIAYVIPFETENKRGKQVTKISTENEHDSSKENTIALGLTHVDSSLKTNNVTENGVKIKVSEVPNDSPSNETDGLTEEHFVESSLSENKLQTIFEQNEAESPRLNEEGSMSLQSKDNDNTVTTFLKQAELVDRQEGALLQSRNEGEDNDTRNTNELNKDKIRSSEDQAKTKFQSSDIENDKILKPEILREKAESIELKETEHMRNKSEEEILDSLDILSSLSENDFSDSSTYTTSKEFEDTVLSNQQFVTHQSIMEENNKYTNSTNRKSFENIGDSPRGGIYEIDKNNNNEGNFTTNRAPSDIKEAFIVDESKELMQKKNLSLEEISEIAGSPKSLKNEDVAQETIPGNSEQIPAISLSDVRNELQKHSPQPLSNEMPLNENGRQAVEDFSVGVETLKERKENKSELNENDIGTKNSFTTENSNSQLLDKSLSEAIKNSGTKSPSTAVEESIRHHQLHAELLLSDRSEEKSDVKKGLVLDKEKDEFTEIVESPPVNKSLQILIEDSKSSSEKNSIHKVLSDSHEEHEKHELTHNLDNQTGAEKEPDKNIPMIENEIEEKSASANAANIVPNSFNKTGFTKQTSKQEYVHKQEDPLKIVVQAEHGSDSSLEFQNSSHEAKIKTLEISGTAVKGNTEPQAPQNVSSILDKETVLGENNTVSQTVGKTTNDISSDIEDCFKKIGTQSENHTHKPVISTENIENSVSELFEPLTEDLTSEKVYSLRKGLDVLMKNTRTEKEFSEEIESPTMEDYSNNHQKLSTIGTEMEEQGGVQQTMESGLKEGTGNTNSVDSGINTETVVSDTNKKTSKSEKTGQSTLLLDSDHNIQTEATSLEKLLKHTKLNSSDGHEAINSHENFRNAATVIQKAYRFYRTRRSTLEQPTTEHKISSLVEGSSSVAKETSRESITEENSPEISWFVGNEPIVCDNGTKKSFTPSNNSELDSHSVIFSDKLNKQFTESDQAHVDSTSTGFNTSELDSNINQKNPEQVVSVHEDTESISLAQLDSHQDESAHIAVTSTSPEKQSASLSAKPEILQSPLDVNEEKKDERNVVPNYENKTLSLDCSQSIESTEAFLKSEIHYSTVSTLMEICEEPCMRKSISINGIDDAETMEAASPKTDDVENSLASVEQILQKPEEAVMKMQQRRSSETPILENKETISNPPSFDEPVILTLESIVVTPNSSAEESDDVIILQTPKTSKNGSHIDAVRPMRESGNEISTVSSTTLKRLHTVAGDDFHTIIKSVTIDETIRYVELTESEANTTSGDSFCLDEDTSENIRQKIMAYSLSEADSDSFEPNLKFSQSISFDAHQDDFNINTALEDTESTSTETESTIVSAATKIQAGARGFLARRRLRRASAGTKSSLQYDTKDSFGNNAISESLETLIENEAAIKIQKAFRKHRREQYPLMDRSNRNLGSSVPVTNVETSLAAKRLTLQRGDALRNNSSPEDEESSNDKTKTDIHEKPKEHSSSISGKPIDAGNTSGVRTKNQKRRNELKWMAIRQNSMPVQIDTEIFRVIPKHMRKKVNSAETNKKRQTFKNWKI